MPSIIVEINKMSHLMTPSLMMRVKQPTRMPTLLDEAEEIGVMIVGEVVREGAVVVVVSAVQETIAANDSKSLCID